jgi:DNA-binding Lrp family transcriptional regulator
MGEDKNREQPANQLTPTQKETARRLGMTEKEYSDNVKKLVASGKLNKGNIT